MIDSLVFNLSRCSHAKSAEIIAATGVSPGSGYGVVTLHRPSNVDEPGTLASLVDSLLSVNKLVPLIFPVHPRTRDRLTAIGAIKDLEDQLTVTPPLPYLDLLGLLSSAQMVLTDSGGIQEETTAMGIPCLTLRHNTERPVTVTEGTNTVVGTDHGEIMTCVAEIIRTGGKVGRIPELWDGHAAERVLKEILDWDASRTVA
jgi:UDP-N-acetylglucosamine 2-epimerase (non-hydrolysing)